MYVSYMDVIVRKRRKLARVKRRVEDEGKHKGRVLSATATYYLDFPLPSLLIRYFRKALEADKVANGEHFLHNLTVTARVFH